MPRRKGHGSGGHASGERWLLTYADLITLLLAFFVVMYALSQTDKKKYEELAKSLSTSFHVLDSGGSQVAPMPPASRQIAIIPAVVPMASDNQALQRIERAINAVALKNGLEGAIQTRIEERGLVVSISNSALFASGDDTILPGARKALDGIAEALRAAPNAIRVEGFTDDTPIHTARFPSNWELSTGRATNVVRFLIDRHHLAPQRLSASGYGQYHPEVPNDTALHRAMNRRVDIVLLRSANPVPAPGSISLQAGN